MRLIWREVRESLRFWWPFMLAAIVIGWHEARWSISGLAKATAIVIGAWAALAYAYLYGITNGWRD